jgi:hypothetical protein
LIVNQCVTAIRLRRNIGDADLLHRDGAFVANLARRRCGFPDATFAAGG